jgi:hypothetical protein
MSRRPVTTDNSQPGLVVRDINTEVATDLVAENHFLIVANAVYDEDGDWVPMTQPTLNATLSGVTIEGETVYKDSRVEYDAYGNAIYTGDNEVMNASEAATDWEIVKIDYDAYSNAIQVRQKTGSWTNRTVGR